MDAILIEQLPASRRALRLAVVTETWLPESNVVARSLARLVAGLRERNHEIQLIRPKQVGGLPAGGDWDELLTGGVPLPRYPNLKLGLPAKRALIAQWTLHRPDVVHVATEGPLGWSALQAAQKLRIPLCSAFSTQLHEGPGYGLGWLKKPIIAYLRKFHQRSLLTLVPNEQTRLELITAGFRNLKVLARGIDCRQFDPAWRNEALRQSWGAGPQTPVLLHVGPWGGDGNLAPLVAACQAVRQRRPGARLVLVGDGPQRKRLRQQLPDAIFVGRLSDEALASCHASADLYLHAALDERSAGGLLAAMASGLPVLAFDTPAAAQYVRHGSDGLLAGFGRNEDFTLRAGELIDLHGNDPERYQALRRNARLRAETFDWACLVGQFETQLFSLF